MIYDLETRAQQAAKAARASVLSAAAYADRAEPSYRRSTAHFGAAVVATFVVLGLVTSVLLSSDTETTRITTDPAAAPITSLPAPSVMTSMPPQVTAPSLPPPPPPQLPSSDPVLGTGTAKNGRRWTLSIGGPSNAICLSFDLGGGARGGSCAGKLGVGSALLAEERYRPLVYEGGVPAFVFGLVPAGVEEVEPELVTGTANTRTRVLTGASDGSYAIELDQPEMITAVIGYRTDGTTLRYPLRD